MSSVSLTTRRAGRVGVRRLHHDDPEEHSTPSNEHALDAIWCPAISLYILCALLSIVLHTIPGRRWLAEAVTGSIFFCQLAQQFMVTAPIPTGKAFTVLKLAYGSKVNLLCMYLLRLNGKIKWLLQCRQSDQGRASSSNKGIPIMRLYHFSIITRLHPRIYWLQPLSQASSSQAIF